MTHSRKNMNHTHTQRHHAYIHTPSARQQHPHSASPYRQSPAAISTNPNVSAFAPVCVQEKKHLHATWHSDGMYGEKNILMPRHNNCQSPQSSATISTNLNMSASASVCVGGRGKHAHAMSCHSDGMCEEEKKIQMPRTIIVSLHSRLLRLPRA